MKAIKWIGPKQYTDFGVVSVGDIIYFKHYPGLADLSIVAEAWIAQGYAEPYEEVVAPIEKVLLKKKIKGGHHG